MSVKYKRKDFRSGLDCVFVRSFFIHHRRGLQRLIGCLDVYFSMHVCTGRCADGLKLKDNCPTLCQFLSFFLPPSLLFPLGPVQMLQPQFKPHNIQQVLQRLFQVIPGRSPYGSWDPARCLRCAVVGNSGNLRGAGYGPVIDGHDFIMR